MKVQTVRFGELEIDQESLISLPEGLVGMEDVNQFCILEEAPEIPVKWLQSIDNPALAFMAVNPYDFFSDYEFEVSGEDAELLGIEKPEDAAILVLLTLGPESEHQITANLVAPMVICTRTQKAKQVILQDDKYTTKHLLYENSYQCAGAGSV